MFGYTCSYFTSCLTGVNGVIHGFIILSLVKTGNIERTKAGAYIRQVLNVTIEIALATYRESFFKQSSP